MAAAGVLLRAGARLIGARHVHVTTSVNKLVQFNLTDIGEGIREVTVKSWFVKENDVVAQFDDICEVESDKATVTITSRYDGKVARLYHDVGGKALVGKPLVDIDVEDEGSDKSDVKDSNATEEPSEPLVTDITPPPKEFQETPPPTSLSVGGSSYPNEWNKPLATPAVRRIAMEHKINLRDVKATGKGGRVMKEDMLVHVEKMKGAPQTTTTSPLTSVQRVMTKTMTDSLKIPQFVLSDEVNVSKLVKLREEAKDAANKKDIKLSFLPFFIKALSKGLKEYPILNSSFDEQREQIVYKQSHNIGIAVDSPCGLLVPNVKGVERMSVIDIARELNRLQHLAAEMKLPPGDLTGGTFSVSNIGSIAGTTATPLILPPEVAIIAIGRILRLPRFDSAGQVTPASILSVSWSADHRILDGATVARCSEVFRYYVENPSALILDL